MLKTIVHLMAFRCNAFILTSIFFLTNERNTCSLFTFTESQACPNRAHIMESGKRPKGATEMETIYTQHFQSCSDACAESLEKHGYVCSAFYYEQDTWLCTTYMHYPDSTDLNDMAQQEAYTLEPSHGDFYRILCGNADRGKIKIFTLFGKK